MPSVLGVLEVTGQVWVLGIPGKPTSLPSQSSTLAPGLSPRGVSVIQSGIPPTAPVQKLFELPGSVRPQRSAPDLWGLLEKGAGVQIRLPRLSEVQQGLAQDTLSELTASRGWTCRTSSACVDFRALCRAWAGPCWRLWGPGRVWPALPLCTVDEDRRAVPEDDGVCGLSTITPFPATPCPRALKPSRGCPGKLPLLICTVGLVSRGHRGTLPSLVLPLLMVYPTPWEQEGGVFSHLACH